MNGKLHALNALQSNAGPIQIPSISKPGRATKKKRSILTGKVSSQPNSSDRTNSGAE